MVMRKLLPIELQEIVRIYKMPITYWAKELQVDMNKLQQYVRGYMILPESLDRSIKIWITEHPIEQWTPPPSPQSINPPRNHWGKRKHTRQPNYHTAEAPVPTIEDYHAATTNTYIPNCLY